MVSIYSLRPGYTILYKKNRWQCNSFFCTKKEKFWYFVVQKLFFAYVRNLEPLPSLPWCAIVRIWLNPYPPSFCVRTMWVTPYLVNLTAPNKELIDAKSVPSWYRYNFIILLGVKFTLSGFKQLPSNLLEISDYQNNTL